MYFVLCSFFLVHGVITFASCRLRRTFLKGSEDAGRCEAPIQSIPLISRA